MADSFFMPDFAEPLARLINEFKHLPGIGQKSAQRLAFHVLRASREDAERLSQAILDVKDKLELCRVCNNISESDLCLYCRDSSRDLEFADEVTMWKALEGRREL